jgi:hypothetical protein
MGEIVRLGRRSSHPQAHPRRTGDLDEALVLWPLHRGGWQLPSDFGAAAMPLELALQSFSANPYFLELRQSYG